MGIINLTEKYLNDHHLSSYERWRIMRKPDLYYGTSIVELIEYFAENPPRQVRGKGIDLARIVMQNIQIKVHISEPINVGNDFGNALAEEFQKRYYFIGDSLGYETIVEWISRDSREFERFQETLGINERSFVTVPRIFLQYELDHQIHDLMGQTRSERRGSLRIYSVEDNKPNLRKPREIPERVVNYGIPALHPI